MGTKRKLPLKPGDCLRVERIRLPAAMLPFSQGLKYFNGKRWILTTTSGAFVAGFPTEEELDNWWKELHRIQGITGAKLRPRPQKEVGVPRPNGRDGRAYALFYEAAMVAFLEFHPEFQRKEISRRAFRRAVETSFSDSFIKVCVDLLSKSPPDRKEIDSGSWLYSIPSGRELNGKTFRESFAAVAQMVALDQEARAADRTRFEHRPVGRSKGGGRWGA